MDIDIYAYFKLDFNATETDIKRAYKAKAKELHPDKNKDNPKAKELFQELQDIYEVLLEPSKKVSYDKQWLAKKEAKERLDKMDAGRRLLKEQLEKKEALAAERRKRQHQFDAKEKLADELRRQFLIEQEEREYSARKERKLLEEAHTQAEIASKFSKTATLKLSWCHKDVSVFDQYTKELMLNCLKVYGTVLNLVIGKRGTAIAEMERASDANKIYEASRKGDVGLASNPISVSWINGKPESVSVDVPVFNATSTEAKQRNEPINDFDAFEEDILSKMAKFS